MCYKQYNISNGSFQTVSARICENLKFVQRGLVAACGRVAGVCACSHKHTEYTHTNHTLTLDVLYMCDVSGLGIFTYDDYIISLSRLLLILLLCTTSIIIIIIHRRFSHYSFGISKFGRRTEERKGINFEAAVPASTRRRK